MSFAPEVQRAVDLAKKGGRLNSDAQWELADALAAVSEGNVTDIANNSDREESTLLQYRRTAERWPQYDRVKGVSFSAHRVVLSHTDPRQVLIDAKNKYGTPTVEQVRREMGLEPHPIIKHLRNAHRAMHSGSTPTLNGSEQIRVDRMLKALELSLNAQTSVDPATTKKIQEEDIDFIDYPDKEEAARKITDPTKEEVAEVREQLESEAETWQPSINISDLQGL